MKKALTLTLALILLLSLTGCGCEHQWQDATCSLPQVCALCGDVQGVSLEHTWAAATCETCETCTLCGAVQGEKLPHSWMDATTEEPETCQHCGVTRGEKILTDERFITANNQALFGTWQFTLDLGEAAPGLVTEDIGLVFVISMQFHNDGVLEMFIAEEDITALIGQLKESTLEETYAEFAAEGIDRDAAQELIMDTLGMTVEEYIDSMFVQLDLENQLQQQLSEFSHTGIYYVRDSLLYVADNWDCPMTGTPFLLENDTLTFPEGLESFGILTLYRTGS